MGLWVGGHPWAGRLSPEPPAGLCLQLRTLPTYQAMLSAAHELPEGSLIFLTDRQELYVRLRGGFRRVLVSGGGRRSTPSWVALPGSKGVQTASPWGFGGAFW